MVINIKVHVKFVITDFDCNKVWLLIQIISLLLYYFPQNLQPQKVNRFVNTDNFCMINKQSILPIIVEAAEP